jgi:hypothetical protein
MHEGSELKKSKKGVAKPAALWDIIPIKGAAPLRALLGCVIRRLFFCPVQTAFQPGGLP